MTCLYIFHLITSNMEQHFTQSNEPIGLMVTIVYMTAQDVTRLGSTSKLYYESVTLNPFTWDNISIKNRTLTKSNLPTTLVARSAVTELLIHTELLRYALQFICEFPRLEFIKLTTSYAFTEQHLATPLLKPDNFNNLSDRFQESFEHLIKSLPPSVTSLDSNCNTWCSDNSIQLPPHIKILRSNNLHSYTHDNEVVSIKTLYLYRSTSVLFNFPKLEELVLDYNEQLSDSLIFPETMHTFISYNHMYQTNFPWTENLGKHVRTIKLFTRSPDQIKILRNPFSNFVFPYLEYLMIVLEECNYFSLACAMTNNIIQQKTQVFPQLKYLVILYHSTSELSCPTIYNCIIGLNYFIGPIPDNLPNIPHTLSFDSFF